MTRRLTPFVVLALAVAAGPLAAQPGPGFDPYRATVDMNLRLYTDPVIQADLKLSDEQKAKFARIPDDLLAKHKDAIEKEKVTSKEASEKQAALQAEVQKKLDALIEKNLTADQRKRLGQMTTQAMGVQAFRDAEIAKALALPEGYQVKLSEIQAAGLERLQKEFPNGAPFGRPGEISEERQKYTDASRKMAQDTIARFVGTLTDEQKKKWQEMIGEPSEAVTSGASRPAGPMLGTSFGPRFFPGTTISSRNQLIGNAKALDELKVEKAARDAITEGLKAILESVRPDGSGGLGRDPRAVGAFNLNSVARTIALDTISAAGQVLTQPQTKRLEQIRFQMSGTGVFSLNASLNSGPVIEFVTATGGGSFASGGFGGGGRGSTPSPLLRLTLTPAQVKKIDAVLADAGTKHRELGPQRGGFGTFGPPTTAQTEAQKKAIEERAKAQAESQRKYIDIDQKAMAEITATFDAGQMAAWKELTGESIDLSKLAYTSFSRRGPGGFVGRPATGRAAPSIVTMWTLEASRQMNRGEYAAALATYDEALRLAPTTPLFAQNKVRLLASCPSEWVRDGKQAVELMKKVMAEAKEPTYTQYDVLAMAHAEAGQFDDAVKAQEKAISMLPPPAKGDDTGGFGGSNLYGQLKPQYEARLKLYQEKKPYRQELPKAKTPAPKAVAER
jgi:tetratricopeptide (TPR) repeat protein